MGQMDRQTGMGMDMETDRHRDKQMDRQTNMGMDRRTWAQTDGHGNK